MTIAIVEPTESLSGDVVPPPSKSYTHRALFVAALSEHTVIENPLISDDTMSSIRVLKALGAEIELGGEEVNVMGFGDTPSSPEDVLNASNSGTTLRFAIPLCSFAKHISVLTGDYSLKSRPNTPLLSAIQQLGGFAVSTRGDGKAPIVVYGGE